MRTWRQHELGEPTDVLVPEDVAPPVPSTGEVLLDVTASALNFPDALYCRGQYQDRPPLPFAPGLEVAGVVRSLGDGVTGIAVGQRVAALPLKPWGGLSEQTLTAAAMAFPIPDSLGDAAAASLPITYQTGWVGLFHRAGLQAGETLLVHAGAGGVGSAAIQLGVGAGATVIATAGGPAKVEVCRTLGAHHAIDYIADDFVAIVKELTAGRGADVIYDPVGGDVFDRSRKVIAWEGRLVVIGFTSGRIPEVPANHVLLKNYSVVGVHWGAYNRRNPALVHRCHDALMRLHAEGSIAPLIQRLVPFDEAPSAIAAVASRASWGKLVVMPPVA